jgi:hypothetical protein
MHVLCAMLVRKIFISLYVHLMTIYITSIAYLSCGTHITCMPTPNYTQYMYSDHLPYHITFHNMHLYVHMYVHPVYPNQPHMYPREDTLKRRTCICTREDTLLSEHMPYVDARAHAQTTTGCVTREPKRGHPQMRNTCWGTPHAPVETPPRRASCTRPRGHPLGEHMPYASSRAHARGTLRLGCGGLFTFTQCNVQNKYIYIQEHIYNVFTYCVSIYIYIQIYVCIHGVLHHPTCTRERTPSSGEHVYAPGRTPSSASICHTWAQERTLKRPQAALHVHPREDTLN